LSDLVQTIAGSASEQVIVSGKILPIMHEIKDLSTQTEGGSLSTADLIVELNKLIVVLNTILIGLFPKAT
jgi:hypothetical protein